MFYVIVGCAKVGFTAYGPFADKTKAEKWIVLWRLPSAYVVSVKPVVYPLKSIVEVKQQ